jgi:hypothetical protein
LKRLVYKSEIVNLKSTIKQKGLLLPERAVANL